MSYNYQNDDMDALRVTFEDMIFEIESLKNDLAGADDAIMDLYNEANDLERELHLLREHHEQSMFDATEDYIELEREYNELAAQFAELFDEVNPVPEYDENQWDFFEVNAISFN